MPPAAGGRLAHGADQRFVGVQDSAPAGAWCTCRWSLPLALNEHWRRSLDNTPAARRSPQTPPLSALPPESALARPPRTHTHAVPAASSGSGWRRQGARQRIRTDEKENCSRFVSLSICSVYYVCLRDFFPVFVQRNGFCVLDCQGNLFLWSREQFDK